MDFPWHCGFLGFSESSGFWFLSSKEKRGEGEKIKETILAAAMTEKGGFLIIVQEERVREHSEKVPVCQHCLLCSQTHP